MYMLDAYKITNLVLIICVGPVWFSILGIQMVTLAVYPYCSGVGGLYGLYEMTQMQKVPSTDTPDLGETRTRTEN